MSKVTSPFAGIHARPSCGHRALAECPLSSEDWRVVYLAWLGFLATCRIVAEQAHARTEPRGRAMSASQRAMWGGSH
jgi:hypothetical protein